MDKKEPQIIQSLHLSQPPQLAVVYFFEADVLFQAGVLFSENIIINENPHIFLMKLPEKSSKIPKHQVRQPKQQVRHPSEKNTTKTPSTPNIDFCCVFFARHFLSQMYALF